MRPSASSLLVEAPSRISGSLEVNTLSSASPTATAATTTTTTTTTTATTTATACSKRIAYSYSSASSSPCSGSPPVVLSNASHDYFDCGSDHGSENIEPRTPVLETRYARHAHHTTAEVSNATCSSVDWSTLELDVPDRELDLDLDALDFHAAPTQSASASELYELLESEALARAVSRVRQRPSRGGPAPMASFSEGAIGLHNSLLEQSRRSKPDNVTAANENSNSTLNSTLNSTNSNHRPAAYARNTVLRRSPGISLSSSALAPSERPLLPAAELSVRSGGGTQVCPLQAVGNSMSCPQFGASLHETISLSHPSVQAELHALRMEYQQQAELQRLAEHLSRSGIESVESAPCVYSSAQQSDSFSSSTSSSSRSSSDFFAIPAQRSSKGRRSSARRSASSSSVLSDRVSHSEQKKKSKSKKTEHRERSSSRSSRRSSSGRRRGSSKKDNSLDVELEDEPRLPRAPSALSPSRSLSGQLRTEDHLPKPSAATAARRASSREHSSSSSARSASSSASSSSSFTRLSSSSSSRSSMSSASTSTSSSRLSSSSSSRRSPSLHSKSATSTLTAAPRRKTRSKRQDYCSL
eukprot:CAMPEP_0174230488 /NCGR_PEP_ID=MMETSP0417-20130205/1234_1 /TAXON_ID=242541 /ORGANISM="Mayorella sp, Strain BSH-02190019" /LENGTH=583 /DNA_ID=CAMNT_0015308187 /DNA_START=125 /DNA_END=1876 /DNA_ORIENTATION=+